MLTENRSCWDPRKKVKVRKVINYRPPVSNQQSYVPQSDNEVPLFQFDYHPPKWNSNAFKSLKTVMEKEKVKNEMYRFKSLFSFWVAARQIALQELEEVIRKLEKLEEVSEMTSSINKSVGITGAVAAVTGSILLPFTLGISSAGVVSGAVITLSSVTALTASKVAERRSVLQLLNKCRFLIELDREWSHRLIKYIAKEIDRDLLNSLTLPYERNIPYTLAYLKSFILPTFEEMTDDLSTAQDFSESEGLLENEGVSTERKVTSKKMSSVNSDDNCSVIDYNAMVHLITVLQSRLSKCASIHKEEIESVKEKLFEILSNKLDKTEPLCADEEKGFKQPNNDSEKGSFPNKISDNEELDFKDQFEDLRELEQVFSEATEMYRNSKNIRYISKLRKVRSKPKSIRSLIYILQDLKNTYYDQLFMLAGYHKFLSQKEKNLCCKHGCVQLFYYTD